MTHLMTLMRYEIKNITRDKMTLTMLVYPIIMVGFGAYLIPLILNQFDTGENLAGASLIIMIVLASLAPMLAGAMLGFLLLDHKDENTLISLRVTPVSLLDYLRFKSLYTVLLSFLSSLLIVLGVRFLSGDAYTVMGFNPWTEITVGGALIFSAVSALFAPTFGLMIATLGANKIEGFAYIKTLGILILIPALVTLEAMQGAAQYFLGVVPTFWPVKGLLEGASILPNEANLPAVLYSLLGLLYLGGLLALLTRQFIRSIQS